MKYIACFLSVAILTGCTSLKESTLLGIGIGTVVGAGFGAAAGSTHNNEKGGAAVGAVVGAAVGGLIGFLDHKEREKKAAMKIEMGNSSKGSETPFLTKPKVQKVWVPEKIDGDKYISGHWIYLIERQSVWSKE